MSDEVMKKIFVAAIFDPKLEREVRLVAAELDISKSELLRRAAAAYVDRFAKQREKREAQHASA